MYLFFAYYEIVYFTINFLAGNEIMQSYKSQQGFIKGFSNSVFDDI